VKAFQLACALVLVTTGVFLLAAHAPASPIVPVAFGLYILADVLGARRK